MRRRAQGAAWSTEGGRQPGIGIKVWLAPGYRRAVESCHGACMRNPAGMPARAPPAARGVGLLLLRRIGGLPRGPAERGRSAVSPHGEEPAGHRRQMRPAAAARILPPSYRTASLSPARYGTLFRARPPQPNPARDTVRLPMTAHGKARLNLMPKDLRAPGREWRCGRSAVRRHGCGAKGFVSRRQALFQKTREKLLRLGPVST